MLELDRYVSKLDIHRMYHEGLFNHINTILSDENISVLNAFNDLTVNNEIVLSALKSGNALSYRFISPLLARLERLATNDPLVNKKKEQFIRHHKQINYWEKRKVGFILFIVLLICIIIFLANK